MGEEVPYSESYKRVLYIESVYRKHGITQADFDTSMVWYARHPDALTKSTKSKPAVESREGRYQSFNSLARQQAQRIFSGRQYRRMERPAYLLSYRNSDG